MYQIAIYVGSEPEVKRFQRFAGVERGPTQAHGELLLPAALDDVANTSTFNFGPSESSAVYFGVSQVGTWQATS